MVFDFYTKKIKVFVAEVPEDVLELRDRLIKVLSRAGMEVICFDSGTLGENQDLMKENTRLINSADCSVHILGNEFVQSNNTDNEISLVEYQLEEAQKSNDSEWHDLKIFIWHPAFIDDASKNNGEGDLISSIRQGIMHNMIYSNRNSVVSFVEDIRSVMYKGKPTEIDVDSADLFFIYNSIDQEAAEDILSLVSDVIDVKKLEILLSADVNYSELVAQQIKKSKMVVIYFNKTADWALPFVQQVWKKIGGASSPTPILFIGDANEETNLEVEFEAPKVVSQIVAQDIIPIEIKVQFDKLTE